MRAPVEPPLDDAPPPEPAPPAPAPAPAPPPAPGHPLALFVAMLLLYVVPGAAAQMSWPVAGLAWTQVFGFLVPAVLFAAASNLAPRRALRIDRAAPRGALAVALLVGLVGFVVCPRRG
jgi:hypothetical protein